MKRTNTEGMNEQKNGERGSVKELSSVMKPTTGAK